MQRVPWEGAHALLRDSEASQGRVERGAHTCAGPADSSA